MLSVLVLSILLQRASAFWRMPCTEMLLGRVDPVVQPGVASAHVHTVVGGNSMSNYSEKDGLSLSNSACTSCVIQADKSAYWTPALYYEYPNGTFMMVPHGGSIVYYLGRGNNATRVPFPPGFRMVVGSAAARSFAQTPLTYMNQRPIAEQVSWLCIADPSQPETYGLNQTDCPYGLRSQIQFPTCWNGIDLYKSDQSHVAHLSGIDSGDCPPTHPYQFAHVFQEIYHQPNDVPDQQPGGRFVLSTGDPTGYSLHADFMNGWDQDVLACAVENCALGEQDGDLQDCPCLLPSYNPNTAQFCPMRPSQVVETVTGLLPKLPGCINIVNGPAAAQPADMNCPPSVVAAGPQLLPTPDTSPVYFDMPVVNQPYGLPNWTYLGCSNDTNNDRALQGYSFSNGTGMTIQTCQAYCQANFFRYAGVEFADECYCGGALLNNPVFGPLSTQRENQCSLPCSGNGSTYCGGGGRIDIYINPTIEALPVPSPKQQVGSYSYKGCYIDFGGARALRDYSVANGSIGPDVCAGFCQQHGSRYFGVEFG
ncbi:WSC-domain-containing protein [Microthyrium microscopicum]|uniref:WSC-domain-containing protein n=1 Tax=Microthyrium microscopicum TaxID=703497 RepID=A0A6A6UB48_9PEZI|nr:WSC-domain-containing protein [Microthyrium microscopicum]